MTLINPSEECFARLYQEFKTTKQKVEEDVQVIKTWLNQQPHLPHLNSTIIGDIPPEVIIQNVLIRCKFSMERTKQTLDLHFTLKTALPEFFSGRDPLSSEIKKAFDFVEIVPLPRLTKDGTRIVLFRMLDKNPNDFQTDYIMKMSFMTADVRVFEDQSFGDTFIMDFKVFGLAHVSKLSLPLMKKLEICIREGYRARVKGVHFINSPPIIEVITTMTKAVMNKKFNVRHHVHTSMESLYQHVDKDVLPIEYGGTERSLSQLAVEWRKKVESYRDTFLMQEKYGRVDESKRPGIAIDTNKLFGIEGTFRQLTVD